MITGIRQAASNLAQKILVSKSTAVYSIPVLAAKAAPNRQPIINGSAPGTLRRRQP